jgi:hypothetical protein
LRLQNAGPALPVLAAYGVAEMEDITLLLLAIALFAAFALYARFCERL